MKKIILSFIMLFTLFMGLSFSSVNAVTENVAYTPTYYDNYMYDLNTGAYISNINWSASSRIVITSDVLTLGLTNTEVHHVLYWDDDNYYLGYENVGSTYQNTKYLGVFTGAVPANAGRFAITTNKNGVDTLMPGSGDSYDSVFAFPDYTYSDAVLDHSIDVVFGSPTYLNYTDTVLTGDLSDMASPIRGGYTDAVLTDALSNVFASPTYLNYVTEYSSRTLDDIFTSSIVTIPNIGYSSTTINNQATEFAYENVDVLTLTNLIQNGGLTLIDTTPNDGIADGLAINDGYADSHYIQNNMQYFLSDGTNARSRITTGLYPVITGQNYYISANVITPIGYYSRIAPNFANGSTDQLNGGFTSAIYVSGVTQNIRSYIGSITNSGGTGTQTDGQITGVYQWSVFNSSNFTKTQIDSALATFGYLPYNLSYTLPDTADADFQTLNTNYYIMRGSGIGVGLEIYDFYDSEASANIYEDYIYGLNYDGLTPDQIWDYWRSTYGDRTTTYQENIVGMNSADFGSAVASDFISDTMARDYYVQLYWDAVNHVDRFEWYTGYGVTISNYAFYRQLYDDSVAMVDRYEWYKDYGITAGNFAYYTQLYDDAVATVDRWEWYRDEGVTSANYAYYSQLYADSVAMVDRWEWYKNAGITSGNYTALHDEYVRLLTHYGTTYLFADFELVQPYYVRTVVPPLDSDEVGAGIITAWWRDLATFWKIFIAIGIIAIVCIVLAIARAKIIIILLSALLLTVLFTVVGIFPVWFIMMIAIVLFFIGYLVIKGGSGGGSE